LLVTAAAGRGGFSSTGELLGAKWLGDGRLGDGLLGESSRVGAEAELVSEFVFGDGDEAVFISETASAAPCTAAALVAGRDASMMTGTTLAPAIMGRTTNLNHHRSLSAKSSTVAFYIAFDPFR
jgi:hypothetical protein